MKDYSLNGITGGGLSKASVTFVIAGSTVAILPIAVRMIVTRVQARQWDATASFVFLVAWSQSIRPALGVSFHNVTTTQDVFNERVLIYPGSLNHLVKYSDRLLLILSAVVVIRGIRRRAPISRPAMLALFIVAIEWLASYGNGAGLPGNAQILLAAILLASAFLAKGPGAGLGAAAFGLSLAAVGALVTVINYSAATQPCTYKCGPLGVLFLGATENENALGLVLVLAVPFVYLVSSGRGRIPLTAYVVLLAMITGSRTSQVAAAASFVLLLIVRPSLDGAPEPPKVRLVAWIAAAATMVVGIAIPFLVSSSGALTQRGSIWSIARIQWAHHRWVGNGASAWSKLAETGQIGAAATYSAHNQYLDTLFAAGITGFVVFLLLLRELTRAHEYRPQTMAWCVMFPVLVVAGTERPWSFGGIDWLSWALLASLLVATDHRRERESAPDDEIPLHRLRLTSNAKP